MAEAPDQGVVFVVEDDDSVRNSIADLLRREGYGIRTWPTAEKFLQAVPEDRPAVLIADMRLPGILGVDLHAELVARGNPIPVVYISGQSSIEQSIRAMKQGAIDFLIKPFGRAELMRAVSVAMQKSRREVLEYERQISFDQARARLTVREAEVLEWLLRGCGNKEIAAALEIALPTVKQHKAAVMKKFNAQSLADIFRLKA